MANKYDYNDDSVVVVIGSGAGGGTLANELCQKGVKVVLLEAGKRQSAETFINDEWKSFGQLAWLDKRTTSGTWRVAKDFAGLPAWICKTVGGTTLGMRIGFPRAPDAPFAPVEAKRIVDASRSKSGQLIGVTSRYTELSIAPRWTTIEFDFIENDMLPFFREYGGGMNPFFWAWDIFHRPDEVYLVRLTSSHVHNPKKANGLFYESFSLDMEGVLE